LPDWQTLRQSILATIDDPNAGSVVDRALAKSIRFNRKYRFWFNEGRASFTTLADTDAYALATDCLGLIGSPVYVQAGDPQSRRTLRQLTTQAIEDRRHLDSGTGQIVDSSYPRGFSIFESQLVLHPAPANDGDEVHYRYVQDLGTPYVRFDGTSGWRVLDPNTDLPLLATFETALMDHGEDLVSARALYYLYRDHYKEETQAQLSLTEWAESLHGLRVENHERKGQVKVRGWF
jgi:hypothetical protein